MSNNRILGVGIDVHAAKPVLAAIRAAGYNVTECIVTNSPESDSDIENALAIGNYAGILIGSISHDKEWHARIANLAQKTVPGIKVITPANRDVIVSTIQQAVPYKPQEYVEEAKTDSIV